MSPLAALALAGCIAVPPATDHITAGLLASAFPGLTAVAPETPLGFAPAPGVVRLLHGSELRLIAERMGVDPPAAAEICVTRPVASLDPARLLAAMQRQLPAAAIEILDYSRQPAPEGELEFPLAGLRQVTGGGFWSGSIGYAGNRRFLVWAKVKILVTSTRVAAAVPLTAAHPIDAGDLRLETSQEFPDTRTFVSSIEGAAGRVLRRPVAAGTVLRAQWLEAPADVVRGETVKVEVWNGGAHLELDAQAEASGSAGDTIAVRNPISNKRFQARVEGKGRVSVGKVNP